MTDVHHQRFLRAGALMAARLNPAFAEGIDRANVVGHGLGWRDPGDPRLEQLCVLQAEVRGMPPARARPR